MRSKRINRSKGKIMKKAILVLISLSCMGIQVSAKEKWEFCAIDTSGSGKLLKCHHDRKSCERYIQGRRNWECVLLQTK